MKIDSCLKDLIKNQEGIQHKFYSKGTPLFEENAEPKGVYLIKKGSVKQFRIDKKGEERILYLAGSGELLGTHAVINKHPYVTTAIALSDTEAYFLPSRNFMDFIDSNSTYKLLVMKSLCSKIDAVENNITSIVEKISEERLADILLMLIDKYGISNSKILNIEITVDELAGLTCTSKSYMKKIVNSFSQKGLLRIYNDIIKILDLPEIKKYSKSA